jgi:hypothetical protein
MEGTNQTHLIFWMVLFTLFWLGIFVLPAFRLKRAILQVIQIFRRQQSFCSSNSKTQDELGLAPPPMWDGFFRLRDFKPFAIRVLVKAGVIHLSENGKMCLQENKAAEFLAANRITE